MSAKRDAYVAKMKAQLDNLNASIDQLEAKANAAAADVQAKAKIAAATVQDKTKAAAADVQDKAKAAAADVQDKAKAAVATASAGYTQAVSKLRDQSKLAGAKLDELKAAGEAAWDTQVAQMDKLHGALKDAVAVFKSKV
jgi:DNA repair exonuclease SbcCD ATPase subunit